jgi:hypothetical protein
MVPPSGDPPLSGAEPSEPPPPYSQTAGNTSASQSASSSSRPQQDSSHLQVPGHHKVRNGIPPSARRSMEDEARSLPAGWVRQFDASSRHQFFVDTRANPPRAIWHHPYDDEQYLNSLSPDERSRIQSLHRIPSEADIQAESSDPDTDNEHHLPPREAQPKGMSKFTRKMKDKLTASTHEERERAREQRARDEQAAYERHQHIRACMAKAIETGQPQLLGKDKSGKDVYIEPPPQGMGYGMGRGMGMGMGGMGGGGYAMGGGYPGQMGYGGGGYGWGAGPYGQNSMILRPQMGYGRPYGGGYGGGMGLPLIGGLAGGALLGGMLF